MKSARLGQWFDVAGVAAAMVLAVLVNVYAARHYRRWDLTTHGLYTLSPATLDTLHVLAERVEVDVLLSSNDPLTAMVRPRSPRMVFWPERTKCPPGTHKRSS